MLKKFLTIVIAVAVGFSCIGCGDTISRGITKKNEHETDGEELSIFSYKPDTFCPIASNNKANVHMLNIVYEGLIELTNKLVPLPMLADSWIASENGLKWTINLKKNVSWHDGSGKLTANDVVFTVNQIKAFENSSYKYNVSNILSVEAVGKNQVIFTLAKPNANFVNLLYFPIIKSQDEEIDLLTFRPNGTGPYRLEDRNEGNIYYLVKNQEWWGGKASAEAIKVKMLPSGDTALYAFGSGGLDLVPAENMDWGKFVDPSSASYTTIKTPIYNFLGVNHNNKLLSASELRKAISLAVDRDEIIDEARMGYAVPANSPVRPEWSVCENQTFNLKQNVAAAKKLLENNGWNISGNVYRKMDEENNYSADFSILINEENTVRENMARIISKNLEEFGIRTSIVRVPYDEYQKRINEGKYDTFIGSIILPPNLEFSKLLGDGNMFNFSDDEMQFVLDSMQTKTDSVNMKAGYAEFINLFEQLNPVIGLFFNDSVMIYTKQISDEIKPSYFDIYRGIETIKKGA